MVRLSICSSSRAELWSVLKERACCSTTIEMVEWHGTRASGGTIGVDPTTRHLDDRDSRHSSMEKCSFLLTSPPNAAAGLVSSVWYAPALTILAVLSLGFGICC